MFYNLLCFSRCVFMCVHLPMEAIKDISFLGIWVTGVCESSHSGAGYQLWSSDLEASILNCRTIYLSSPPLVILVSDTGYPWSTHPTLPCGYQKHVNTCLGYQVSLCRKFLLLPEIDELRSELRALKLENHPISMLPIPKDEERQVTEIEKVISHNC